MKKLLLLCFAILFVGGNIFAQSNVVKNKSVIFPVDRNNTPFNVIVWYDSAGNKFYSFRPVTPEDTLNVKLVGSGSTTVTGSVSIIGTPAVSVPGGVDINSMPNVTLNGTSNVSVQGAVTVNGDFYPANQPVSGTITANAGTDLNTSALALESGGNLDNIKANTDKIPAQGQTTKSGSTPVTLASDQEDIGVDGSNHIQPVSGAVSITGTSAVSIEGGVDINGTVPVSVTDLPLPLGAATAANQQTDALTDIELRATPVPVSGTISLSGTSAVSIQGTPDVNIGTMPDVIITGTPAITGSVNILSLPDVTLAGTSAVSVQGTPVVDINSMPNVTIAGTPSMTMDGVSLSSNQATIITNQTNIIALLDSLKNNSRVRDYGGSSRDSVNNTYDSLSLAGYNTWVQVSAWADSNYQVSFTNTFAKYWNIRAGQGYTSGHLDPAIFTYIYIRKKEIYAGYMRYGLQLEGN